MSQAPLYLRLALPALLISAAVALFQHLGEASDPTDPEPAVGHWPLSPLGDAERFETSHVSGPQPPFPAAYARPLGALVNGH